MSILAFDGFDLLDSPFIIVSVIILVIVAIFWVAGKMSTENAARNRVSDRNSTNASVKTLEAQEQTPGTLKQWLQRAKEFLPKPRSTDGQSLEKLLPLLTALNEWAKDSIKEDEKWKPSDEALLLATLDNAFARYSELLLSTQETQSQHLPANALHIFLESIRSEIKAEYGVKDRPTAAVNELILFGDWCEEQNITLTNARKLITFGHVALKSYNEIYKSENKDQSSPTIEHTTTFFTELPVERKTLQMKLQTAVETLEQERAGWEQFALEKGTYDEKIAELKRQTNDQDKKIGEKDSTIKTLEGEKQALTNRNAELSNQADASAQTLQRINEVARIAETFQEGRRGLTHLLEEDKYRAQLAFLMYYSLFNLCISISSGDEMKQRLMLINLYFMAEKCKGYKDNEIKPFDDVHNDIGEMLKSDYKMADIKQERERLKNQANFTEHADIELFSIPLRELRSNLNIPLAPFFIDHEKNKPMGAI